MTRKTRLGLFWGSLTFIVNVLMCSFVGAAYDVNHNHSNLVGLHTAVLIGISAGIALGFIVGTATYFNTRNYE